MDTDDYTVVPVPLLDSTLANTEIVFRVSLILDAPLSFEKLQESWYQALEARPIMQAHVRRSPSAPSGLEYHVWTPKGMEQYLEKQRRAPDHLKDFFCLDQSHRSISDYFPGVRIGSRAPCQSEGIFVSDSADPQDQNHCTAFNGVQSLDELLNSDRTTATVQVTRFSDATILSISMSHIVGDLFVIKAMFKAWESALHGISLAPMENLGRDPFSAYGPGGQLSGSNAHLLPPGWRVYGLLDKARLLSRFLWDSYVSRPERSISPRYIFIPESEVQDLEKQAKRDLLELEERRQQQRIEGQGSLVVSRSNVLHAWLLKHNHAHLDPGQWSTTITIVNARARPPVGMKIGSDDFPSHNWYGAAMAVALPSLKVGDLMSMSLGELAMHIRKGIEAGSSAENARRWLTFTLHHQLWKKPSGKFVFWSPPDHHWSGLSDWRLIPLADVDMTPARLDQVPQRVAICSLNAHMVRAGTQRNRWVCLGQAGGGIWLAGTVSEAEWQNPRGFGKYPHILRRTTKLSSEVTEERSEGANS
ncbi:hypothetical protein BGW36DRAFT_307759 [Talaromyces proteolyticus]|uniref:Uncharacterized protein n=1 Tax=Talaromyces proteolyticus TaxID=1131652 RepID=A0AAD4KG43_9EURO|nr:uncharacterized protein BGW36DRAFT_307759 [Talaromyces proteolyticus]KAH8690246.1 hypothetical protein BGW36DRAFT_307759 [Talaromyces proteolyticus]